METIERALFSTDGNPQTIETQALSSLTFIAYHRDSVAAVVRGSRRKRSVSAFATAANGSVRGRSRRGKGRRTRVDGRATITNGEIGGGGGKIRHSIIETRLRLAIADFCWELATAYIPSVVLTNQRRALAAEQMAKLLDSFR